MSDGTSIKNDVFIRDERLALADSLRRERRFDDARAVLEEHRCLLDRADVGGALANAVARSKVERSAGDLATAFSILMEASPLAELCQNEEMLAAFHGGLAATYQRAGLADKALIEHEAAAFHWERAGRPYDAGCTENNLALLVAAHDREKAFDLLARARAHFAGMPVKLAEVDETEACVRLALGGETEAAFGLALEAVRVFRATGERTLLLDSLPTLIKAAVDLQAEMEASSKAGSERDCGEG